MCDAILVVPGGLPLPALRGRVRRYFDERYGHEHVVFVFIPFPGRCYARVEKLLPRQRGSHEILHIEKTFDFDIQVGAGNIVMEVPA